MGMLTQEDIKLIGEEVGNVIEQNIMPQFDELRSEMKAGFDAVDRRFDRIEGKTNTLINVLQEKNVITEGDKRRVLS